MLRLVGVCFLIDLLQSLSKGIYRLSEILTVNNVCGGFACAYGRFGHEDCVDYLSVSTGFGVSLKVIPERFN